MKDEIEKRLSRLTPRGAPDALRDRVLLVVEEEIGNAIQRGRHWERLLGLVTVAAILLGIVLNVWTVESSRMALARLSGSRPTPHGVTDTVEAIEAVAGAEAADWVRQRFLATRARSTRREHLEEHQLMQQEMIQRAMLELELTKGRSDGENKDLPEASGDNRGRADRRFPDHQRDSYLDGGRTA